METEKTEIIIADKFYSFINLKEDFKRKYNDLSNKGYLLSQLENDVDFMSAFQDDFRKTDMEPDVNKYWRLIYTKEQLDACISNLHNVETTILHFPLESELIARKIEFYNIIKEGKEPKDCYTHKIEETNIYKQFRAIEDIYNRFKEMKGFDSSADSLRQQAEEFGKGLISEIQNINYEPIRTKVIELVVNDKDNIYSYTKSRFNKNFNKKEFEDNYAKAKMYLDNYLTFFIEEKQTKTSFSTSKEQEGIIKYIEADRKFIAKEYALAYVFGLYSKGEHIPCNRTNDAGLDSKYLISIGAERTENKYKGDTFYRAVKEVIKYDLNNIKDLNNISTDWLNAVLTISKNDPEIIQYLSSKELR